MNIAIVGAGPAGSSVAYEAAQNKDHNVVVVEKRRIVGHPYACAGGLSEPMLEKELPWLKDMPQGVILNRIKRVVLKSENETAQMRAKDIGRKSIGIIVDRELFDQWLFNRAQRAGAKLVRGKATWMHVKRKNVDLTIESKGNSRTILTANTVVGADGAMSTIGRFAGIIDEIPPEDLHHGYQETIWMPDYPSDTITMWFSTRWAPRGYVWAFPEGGGGVRLGVGVPLSESEAGRNPRYYLAKFKGENKDHDYTGEIMHRTSGLLSTRPPMRSCVNQKGNIALVGCAGAMTSSLHGGGILHGIIAGEELGKVIAEGKPLKEYDKRWKRRLWRRLRMHYRLKQMIYGYSDQEFDRLCRVMSRFKLKGGNVDREILRFIKHVFRTDPKLLPEFIVGMLK